MFLSHSYSSHSSLLHLGLYNLNFVWLTPWWGKENPNRTLRPGQSHSPLPLLAPPTQRTRFLRPWHSHMALSSQNQRSINPVLYVTSDPSAPPRVHPSINFVFLLTTSILDIDPWFWMHETSARGGCPGNTQRDQVEREVGGGIGMGNTCISMADSCQCMTKTTTIL